MAEGRGPSAFGIAFGALFITLSLWLFGIMVAAYLNLWGLPGVAFALALLPISAPVYPFVAWYHTGAFPWLWAAGLVTALVMGAIVLNE